MSCEGCCKLIAATTWFWIFSVGFLIAGPLTIFLILGCPFLRLLLPLYLIWIVYDRKTSEKGGRPIQWVRNLSWFTQMKNYFNYTLIPSKQPLDAKKNYLFACYPHGILPVGIFAGFINPNNAFPSHKTFVTALGIQFWMPFIRELYLSIGGVGVTAPALKYLLRADNGGGNIVPVVIGGGEEGIHSRPGTYKIILKKRKGFIKLALQQGSPIVPVFTFGETDVFEQLNFPGMQLIRRLVQIVAQVVIVLPLGRYFVCPNKVTVTTVVGEPIQFERNPTPNQADIDNLHAKFVVELQNLFESNKGKYVKNPENTHLEIV